MQSFLPSAIAALTLLAAGAAVAQPPGAADFNARATLASAVASPKEAVISGVNWRCEADQCRGVADRAANADSLIKECKKVSAVVGPLSAYQSRGRALSDGQLKACNRASQVETAQK